MKLQIFENEKEIKSEEMLRAELLYRHESYGAFWLVIDEPSMGLFINNNLACLFYAGDTEGGDTCCSVNREFAGNEDDTVDFLLENYQLDEISETTVISMEQAVNAFVSFYNTGKLSSDIAWE